MRIQPSKAISTTVLGALLLLGAGPGWAFTQNEVDKLLASDGAMDDQFGRSVAVSGDIAIIGAHFDDDNGVNSGSAYVFDLSGATGTVNEAAKLLPSDGAVADQFGFSVAVSGSTAVIGARLDDDDGSDSGSAYVFSLVSDSDGDGIPDDVEQALTGDPENLTITPVGSVSTFSAALDPQTGEITIEGFDDMGNLLVSVTLPPGSSASSGQISLAHTMFGPFGFTQTVGIEAPTPPGKAVTFIKDLPSADKVCFVDDASGVFLDSRVTGIFCATDPSISRVLMDCPLSPLSQTVTVTGFPDAPTTRTFTCQEVDIGGVAFMTVTGLRFSAIAEFLDKDDDGVDDFNDSCPNSDVSPMVVIDGCDSGVPNTVFDDGCSISDQVAECAEGAKNHGKFVSCVAKLTNNLKKAGIITGAQKGAIQSCAAQADIP